MKICLKFLLLAALVPVAANADMLCRKKLPTQTLSSKCDASGKPECSSDGNAIYTDNSAASCTPASAKTACDANARYACINTDTLPSGLNYLAPNTAGKYCWCGAKFYYEYSSQQVCEGTPPGTGRCAAICPPFPQP